MNLKLGNRIIGDEYRTYIIAEIGSNFDGSLKKACELIDAAKECGCDCAKFQSFIPDKIINRHAFQQRCSFQTKWNKTVYDTYRDASLPRKGHESLIQYCEAIDIDFMSSPYDIEAVDLLDELNVPAFKIGSGEITNLKFLEYVASKKKPIILGTGASNMGEIAEAVSVIHSQGNRDLVLLQCTTQYPTPLEHTNVRAMNILRKAFGCLVGFSDHSEGYIASLGAVANGACVIEKHFTLDKSLIGPDHPFAMDREDMTLLVEGIRKMEKAMGSHIKQLYDIERETVILQRRSLFAKTFIPCNAIITEDVIDTLRPATGIEPKYLNSVIGLRTTVDIKAGEPIEWEKLSC